MFNVMTNKLVLALTYYNSPLMLAQHLKTWCGYSETLAHQIKVILIDDGSREHPAEKEIKKWNPAISIELYRIIQDIPQNTFGARNLAFHIANVEGAEWVLNTDIDHVLPATGLFGFVDLRIHLTKALHYFPARYAKTPTSVAPISKHSDTYLIAPSLYWRAGGYDEDLIGYYFNGAAYHFRKSLARISTGVDINKVFTVFYPSSIISDASPLQDQEKKRYVLDVPKDKKPSVLNFEWERVL